MATRLGTPWPPTMERTPPHMAPEDHEIYRAWWPQHASRALMTFYDVGVGSGRVDAIPLNAPDSYAGAWIHNTQKRIDMMAVMPGEIWLIEIRHYATSNAIGRLLQYKLLWLEDPVLQGKLKVYLISNSHDPDLAKLAALNDITYNWV